MNLSVFLPVLILLLFIPILLSGRKQKRQMQNMQQLQKELNDGDVVMTTSGLRATVVDSSYEETIDLEIAPGVVTTWLRGAVREKVDLASETGSEAQTGDVEHSGDNHHGDNHVAVADDTSATANGDPAADRSDGGKSEGVAKPATDAPVRD